jgi:hypothetical protein
MEVGVKLERLGGGQLPNNSETSVVNNFMHSLFRFVSNHYHIN